ncbi:MAG: ROK family transcriptional regulator [Clostridiales bacterium]|nr:ROK family transcriptional regulator [Clostridiales bacterium]
MKPVNQQLIKNHNLKTLYHYIHQEPGISRAQLAKLSRLSKTTVSSLVDELIERNFIQDTGILEETPTVGRKPNGLQLFHGQHYVAVISWRKKEVWAKLVDICGTIVKEASVPLSEPDTYVPLSVKLLEKLISSDFSKAQILGVCIVVPAMIDLEKKEIFATTLYLSPGKNHGLLKDLQTAFSDYAVAILNDTACAAYAEKIYTKIPQADFAYINFQHGIGAALFIQNQLLGQATASYTQFGHYSIDPDGKQCTCGNKGCLELMIGENALKERLLEAGCSSALCRNEKVTYADLCSYALYGDLAAQKVIRDIANDFSLALSNLVCLVHPKLIIIGGKGKDLGPLFLEEVLKSLKNTGFRQMLDSLQIRYSFLDSTAYFVGGMKYFFDIHYDFTQEPGHFFYLG